MGERQLILKTIAAGRPIPNANTTSVDHVNNTIDSVLLLRCASHEVRDSVLHVRPQRAIPVSVHTTSSLANGVPSLVDAVVARRIPVRERGPVVQEFAAVRQDGVACRPAGRAIGDVSLARQNSCSSAKDQVKSEGGGGDKLHD